MAAHSLFGFLSLVCCFLLLHSAAAEEMKYCPRSFDCGMLGKIYFPFTNMSSECGLPITGCNNPGADKEVELKNHRSYKVEGIYQKEEYNSISIHDSDREFEKLLDSKSCDAFNFTYDPLATIIPPESAMMSFQIVNSFTFLRCNHNHRDLQVHENIFKYPGCPGYVIYYSNHIQPDPLPLPPECSVIHLPIELKPISNNPFNFLAPKFVIEVTLYQPCLECHQTKGQCQLDRGFFRCVINDEHKEFLNPLTEHKERDWKKIGLYIGLACMTTIALFAIILLLYKRRRNSLGYQNKARNIYSGPYSSANPESGAVYFGIPVFSYEELQEATNNFDEARELGEGGFGTVYYGKLRDGREVAVKRLYERNYKPVETFINEIQILTRLRHTNLVSLYGCTSRHSRELLLVYEYIPNGTVSYHLHGEKAKPGSLPWPVRMKIAIETASALTYLHASDIIHRDVKTSNILLDNNFCVKVADFGLSRLFPTDVTHVSTAPRGTPGYVDPDYRLCYQLTSKSDVYSFGVVLVELISSMPAVDLTRDRDEIKLANLAIRKIRKGAFGELVDPSLGFQSDDKLRRVIISVAELAFQCLQGEKDLRPSMGEVLEVLQRIESGRDEPGNRDRIDVHVARVSQSYAHPSLANTRMKPQRLPQTL